MNEVRTETASKTAQEQLVPYAVLAELTHRCPLHCPDCTNPIEREKASTELATATWLRVIGEAAEMGMLHVHFSGGEPTVRKDLEEMVAHGNKLGLYTNLITSGVLLDEKRLTDLCDRGLDHVQLSFQDTETESADRIAGFQGHEKKIEVARLVRKLDLPLTVNAVMHRQNLHNLPAMIDLAVELDAERLEVAQVQYYAWALRNRAAFLPTREQLDEATALVAEARERLKGVLAFDYVVPDYYARRPKVCMGGWGRRFMNIGPSGQVMPCHAADTIPDMEFDNVREKSLAWIWENSEAFLRYRGTAWMPEPCRSCDQREIDWGGCRCQALLLTGDAANTDPACEFSPMREVFEVPFQEAKAPPPDFIHRRYGG